MLKTSWEAKYILSLPVYHDRCTIGINDINIGEGFITWTPREPSKCRISFHHSQGTVCCYLSFLYHFVYFVPLKSIYWLPIMCKELWKIETCVTHGPCHPRNPRYSKRTQDKVSISLNIRHHQLELNQNNNFIGKRKINKYT